LVLVPIYLLLAELNNSCHKFYCSCRHSTGKILHCVKTYIFPPCISKYVLVYHIGKCFKWMLHVLVRYVIRLL